MVNFRVVRPTQLYMPSIIQMKGEDKKIAFWAKCMNEERTRTRSKWTTVSEITTHKRTVDVNHKSLGKRQDGATKQKHKYYFAALFVHVYIVQRKKRSLILSYDTHNMLLGAIQIIPVFRSAGLLSIPCTSKLTSIC